MKRRATKTIEMGEFIMENSATGEKISLGRVPTVRAIIGKPKVERDQSPTMLQVSVRLTWWSRAKLRLFTWFTGFKAKYYCRLWTK